MINPIYLANRQGIPRLEDIGISVSTTEVTFNFKSHPLFQTPFSGLIAFKLSAIPSGTTGTLPVVFSSSTRSQALTNLGGVAVTAADLTQEGIYLAFYDSESNLLQILTGI